MTKPKYRFDLGRCDFGGIEVGQAGSGWCVTWRLKHYVQSAEDAAVLAGKIIGVETAAHGSWRVKATMTREEEPLGLES